MKYVKDMKMQSPEFREKLGDLESLSSATRGLEEGMKYMFPTTNATANLQLKICN